MSLREVSLLVYSQGFAVSRDEYIVRELAFCDWTGHHHVLFKYTLPLWTDVRPIIRRRQDPSGWSDQDGAWVTF